MAARHLFGTPGGVILGLMVAMSCAGTLNGSIFVTGKLTLAAAEKGYIPQRWAQPGNLTPLKRRPGTITVVLNDLKSQFIMLFHSFGRSNTPYDPVSPDDGDHFDEASPRDQSSQSGSAINL